MEQDQKSRKRAADDFGEPVDATELRPQPAAGKGPRRDPQQLSAPAGHPLPDGPGH